ncbi:jg5667 [Pararge aegeria aegeria]|uniref:Jg5667 protein n=1 Tax=Pararge aegeria aegeria TaxID=348720 RepID=A0A8S4QSM2_9NEOP|nr:jg5667 [Pararge aegeria aegeria]
MLFVMISRVDKQARGCEDAPLRRRSTSRARPSVSLYRERAAVVVEGARYSSLALLIVCYSRFSDGNARVAGIGTPLIYDAHAPVTKQIFNVM